MYNLPKRIISALLHRRRQLVNSLLDKLEVILTDKGETPLRHPPIFIIGAPRSGSTLLYQAMTEYYDVGYLSNLHCRFYGAPSWLERIVRPLRWRKPSNFTSMHGVTKGIAAPSECGEFWYRFFRRKPQYIPMEAVKNRQLQRMRGAVRALIHAFDKPILFKNMNCALRLYPTAKILPEALFIVTQRNLLDNAHSLLEVRKKVHNDYKTWWSMEPLEINNLKKLPAHEQVTEQVRHIMKMIAKDANVIGINRFFYVDYEDFCKNPKKCLKQLNDFFAMHKLYLETRGKIPSHFKQKKTVQIDNELYKQLLEYIGKQV